MVRFFSPDGFPTCRDKLGRTPDISPLLAGGQHNIYYNTTFATLTFSIHLRISKKSSTFAAELYKNNTQQFVNLLLCLLE